jgi:hypothetical protein
VKNLLAVSSALAWGISQETAGRFHLQADYSGCERFILAQIHNLPGWFKPPFAVLAYCLQFLALPVGRGWFTRLAPEVRARVFKIFEILPGPTREFIRFHRVLVNFYLFEFLVQVRGQ